MIPARGTWWIVLSVLLTIGLYYLPGGDLIVYPVRLFVTFIHEGSHMLAAWVTGGSTDVVAINADGSGHAITRGGWVIVIASAGYLGTLLWGHLLLRFLENFTPYLNELEGWSKAMLMLIGAFVVVLSLMAETLHTFAWGGLIGGTLIYVGVKHRTICPLVVGFLGVQLICNAFYDLGSLLQLSGTGVYTDAVLMQQQTGVPAVFWSVSWCVIALGILIMHLYTLIREGTR